MIVNHIREKSFGNDSINSIKYRMDNYNMLFDYYDKHKLFLKPPLCQQFRNFILKLPNPNKFDFIMNSKERVFFRLPYLFATLTSENWSGTMRKTSYGPLSKRGIYFVDVKKVMTKIPRSVTYNSLFLSTFSYTQTPHHKGAHPKLPVSRSKERPTLLRIETGRTRRDMDLRMSLPNLK